MNKPQDPHTIWSRKRTSTTNFHIPNTKSIYGDSWEELAFAEDAAGSLWPPRSYTCSFCRREFRSAQALGGHMNVHRRDRAKLKQGDHTHKTDLSRRQLENPYETVADRRGFDPKDHTGLDHPAGQHGQTFNSSFHDTSSSREIICQDSCTVVFGSNPNIEDRCIDFSSPSSASRVSVQERSFFPKSLSQIRAINQEHAKRANADRDYEDERSGESDGLRRSVWAFRTEKILGNPKKNTDLTMNLNLGRLKEDEMGILCKRQRIHEPEDLQRSTCKIVNDLGSMEDLDLELRLGASKVK